MITLKWIDSTCKLIILFSFLFCFSFHLSFFVCGNPKNHIHLPDMNGECITNGV